MADKKKEKEEKELMNDSKLLSSSPKKTDTDHLLIGQKENGILLLKVLIKNHQHLIFPQKKNREWILKIMIKVEEKGKEEKEKSS